MEFRRLLFRAMLAVAVINIDADGEIPRRRQHADPIGRTRVEPGRVGARRIGDHPHRDRPRPEVTHGPGVRHASPLRANRTPPQPPPRPQPPRTTVVDTHRSPTTPPTK